VVEDRMPGSYSGTASRRWLAPVLLLLVPLLIAAIARAPWPALGTDNSDNPRADIAATAAIRADFMKVEPMGHEAASGTTELWEAPLFSIRRTLDTMPHGSALSPGDVLSLRAAVEIYASAFASFRVLEREAAPAASADGLEMRLGGLPTRDEAWLREPVLGLRLAVMAADGDDSRSHWSNAFAARLNEAMIPDGTRAVLARKFAAYEHDLSRAGDARARYLAAEVALQAAARGVEGALANASSVLADALPRPGQALSIAREQMPWVLGGLAVAAMTLMASGLSLARAMPRRHLLRG
jgi:hypothetical protein